MLKEYLMLSTKTTTVLSQVKTNKDSVSFPAMAIELYKAFIVDRFMVRVSEVDNGCGIIDVFQMSYGNALMNDNQTIMEAIRYSGMSAEAAKALVIDVLTQIEEDVHKTDNLIYL